MSFSLTTQQVRNHTKTVTRRLGWRNLKPGEQFCAVVKGMGLKKGQKVERICVLECVSNTREPLSALSNDSDYGFDEVEKEGMPWDNHWPSVFIEKFCQHNHCCPTQIVNRIEFKYV